jgi:hypothetical protein
MKLALVLIALGGLGACGAVIPEAGDDDGKSDGSGSGDADIVSGSRIRARLLTTADGLQLRTGLHDSERNEPCSFKPGPDGKLRCIPNVTQQLYGQFYYLDAGCNEPLFVGPKLRCGDLPYLWKGEDDCGTYTLYRLGDEVPLPYQPGTNNVRINRRETDGTCVTFTQGFQPPEAYAAYRVLEELPADAFVEGTESVVMAESRLTRRVITGSDGSKDSVYGMFDRERDQACHPSYAADGKVRCLPLQASIKLTDTFADGACTQPVAMTYGCDRDRPPPTVAEYDSSNACPQKVRIFSMGSKLPGTYSNTSGTCTAGTTQTPYYSIGAEIPAASFIEFARLEGQETGRIQRRAFSTSDGARSSSAWFNDNQLGLLCMFRRASDGTWRCLPQGAPKDRTPAPNYSLLTRYRDAACTQGVTIIAADNQGCTQPRVVWETISGCPSIARVYQVGPMISATLYRKTTACEVAPPDPDFDYYERGAEIPPTEFVEGAESIE